MLEKLVSKSEIYRGTRAASPGNKQFSMFQTGIFHVSHYGEVRTRISAGVTFTSGFIKVIFSDVAASLVRLSKLKTSVSLLKRQLES